MQTKTMRYHCIPIRMAKIKGHTHTKQIITEIIKWEWGCGDVGNLVQWW